MMKIILGQIRSTTFDVDTYPAHEDISNVEFEKGWIPCVLGGFHLLMSFLGSIGASMKASGLEEALEVVYGKNTVPHMISGKAISRAIRGHFLVESALVCHLMTPLIDIFRR